MLSPYPLASVQKRSVQRARVVVTGVMLSLRMRWSDANEPDVEVVYSHFISTGKEGVGTGARGMPSRVYVCVCTCVNVNVNLCVRAHLPPSQSVFHSCRVKVLKGPPQVLRWPSRAPHPPCYYKRINAASLGHPCVPSAGNWTGEIILLLHDYRSRVFISFALLLSLGGPRPIRSDGVLISDP